MRSAIKCLYFAGFNAYFAKKNPQIIICPAYCSHLCRSLSLVEGMLIEEELKKSSNHAVQFGLQLLLQLVLLAYLSNKRQNITYGPATRTLKCYSETKS